jgi:Mor family transcriptional regulator
VDILDDILRRLHDQIGGLAPDARSKIEPIVHDTLGAVRRDWAGDRPYIAASKHDHQRRDACIRADWRAGMSIEHIGQRYAVHTRTVYRALRRGGILL